MTVLTNRRPGFHQESVTSQPLVFAASTIDPATVELLVDDDFMARFHEGIEQLERGELCSFEDVFGESF